MIVGQADELNSTLFDDVGTALVKPERCSAAVVYRVADDRTFEIGDDEVGISIEVGFLLSYFLKKTVGAVFVDDRTDVAAEHEIAEEKHSNRPKSGFWKDICLESHRFWNCFRYVGVFWLLENEDADECEEKDDAESEAMGGAQGFRIEDVGFSRSYVTCHMLCVEYTRSTFYATTTQRHLPQKRRNYFSSY